jgi:hypothetical protein
VNRDSAMSSGACAARVRRFHTWPMITQQTTGEHCARVAKLYCALFGLPRAEVLLYALHHDDGELFAGDSPTSAKWDVPSLKTATDEAERLGLSRLGVEMPTLEDHEFRRVKVCDVLELWETACHELHMGNRYARPIVVDCRRVALERAADTGVDGDETKLRQWLRTEEKRYAEW